MMSIKKIDLIRKYKFDLDMPVRVISYKLDVSPTSVYKYIKMNDFPEMLKKPHRAHLTVITDWQVCTFPHVLRDLMTLLNVEHWKK